MKIVKLIVLLSVFAIALPLHGISIQESISPNSNIYWRYFQGLNYYSSESRNTTSIHLPSIGGESCMEFDDINERIFWCNDGAIYSIDYDGNFLGAPVTLPTYGAFKLPSLIIDIALDPFSGELYWLGSGGASILRKTKYDGSRTESIDIGIDSIDELEIDLESGMLYLGDTLNDQIYRSNLDGSNLEIIVEEQNPWQLDFDQSSNILYWIGELGIARSDAQSIEIELAVPINQDNNFRRITELSVNEKTGELYWLESPSVGADIGFKMNPLDQDGPTRLFERDSLVGDISINASQDRLYLSMMETHFEALNVNTGEIEWVYNDVPIEFAFSSMSNEIYFLNDTLYRLDVSTGILSSVMNLGSRTSSIVIDAQENEIYWVNQRDGQVSFMRTSLIDLTSETLFQVDPEVGQVRRIALDLSEGLVFWSQGNQILSNQLNGDDLTIISTGTFRSAPASIALDTINQEVYWTDGDLEQPELQKASYDGTNLEVVAEDGHIANIAIDNFERKIYWGFSLLGFQKMQRAELDGSNVEDVFLDTSPHFIVIPQN